MPRIIHVKRGDVRVLVVDMERLVDDMSLQEVHQELLSLLDQIQEKRIVLDLTRVGFVSSAALGMLVRIRKRCGDNSIALKICNVSPAIDETFRITGLNTLFEVHDDVAHAIEAFPAAGGPAEMAG